jgi:hypothetical protein
MRACAAAESSLPRHRVAIQQSCLGDSRDVEAYLNLFSAQSLRILLESRGLEALETTTLGKTFTVQYATDAVSHVIGSLSIAPSAVPQSTGRIAGS